MNGIVISLVLMAPLTVTTAFAVEQNPCNDPQVIQEWTAIANKHTDSDHRQRFHAIWLGLCEKVRQGDLNQNRANRLFEEERKEMMRDEERRLKTKVNPFG